MNPDKLFDYLEDNLSRPERAALEKQLISDPQLQRELAIARKIHVGMQGDSREVFMPAEIDISDRGRKMALRLGAAFIILMAVNVGFGLWLIARHASKNPNRTLLETQMRQQISKALERAAAVSPPTRLSVNEITIFAGTGKVQDTAERVITIASQLGGSAVKGLPDNQRQSVLVDLPANRESEFRTAIASIPGAKSQPSGNAKTTADNSTPATAEKKSFVVQIVEQTERSD